MESITINDSKDGEKRLNAEIKYKDGRTKNIKFGMRNSKGTYSDGASDEKRDAYIARHRVRENWSDFTTAGAFSRWVLWDKRSNKDIEKVLKEKTKASKVKVSFKRYNM